MNNGDWGLTERGFRRPVYTELLDALEYKARELFGAKANLTVRSPLGVFLRIYAWILDKLFKVIEDVYNSRFIDTAVGTSLYNLGRAIGLNLLSAQKAAGYIEVTGSPGTVIPKGFLVSTISGLQYTVMNDTAIDNAGVTNVLIQAVSYGPDYNAEANTITQIVNPNTDEIYGVTNPKKFTGGKLRETDEEYRDRYMASVDYAGGVNAEAIAAEIRQSCEGVNSVSPFENDTDEKDALGLPPHSFEQVVCGGIDFDIAQAIFRRKAAGIQTYGNVTVPVINAGGQIVNISFSRPAPVPVWVKIENVILKTGYTADVYALIQQAVINYIGGDISGGFTNGSDVIYMNFPAVIMSVEGVIDFDFTISADGVTYSRSNITIGAREKAVTDADKVVIVS